jgi:hypothetical protein
MGMFPSGWIYQNKLRSNRFFDETARRVEAGERRVFDDRRVPSSPANITSMAEKIYYLLFALAAPAMESVEKRWALIATTTDQARLGCALERYRLAQGRYPENLDALVPESIPALPHDVMTGEPLRYRPAPDGYVLYSVGRNLVDDGGRIDPKKSSNDQLDWAWQIKGASEEKKVEGK